ncbi:MAG: twin-arginine translocase TatA/TatE family subunit [Victivallales bacterium]|jgi:sec-independent protein translocase protein TatA|nr:twin-arginine translocase TatA/TatE family subunit [Victivallales bacterium]
MSIGYTELILILLVILLIFGAKRIPEIARALGKASSEFKKAKNEIVEEGKELTEDTTTPNDQHQDNT